MNLILIPDNEKQIESTKKYVDGYIIGIKNFSVNTGYNLDIDQLNKLNKLEDKQLFISLNKNIENNDLPLLKDIMMKLNDFSIKGVIYSDVSIVELYQELDLNYELIWSQEHLTTNYETINYWKSFGVKYTILSNDITLKEMIDIRKNTDSQLMVMTFGYLPMFVSKRHIVKNYLKYFGISDKSSIYYMKKEGKKYPIIDNEIGTMVFSNNIINSMKEYYKFVDSKIDYMIINGFQIDDKKLVEVIKMYRNITPQKVFDYNKKINDMFKNIDTGFMYQETVSKVKINETKS